MFCCFPNSLSAHHKTVNQWAMQKGVYFVLPNFADTVFISPATENYLTTCLCSAPFSPLRFKGRSGRQEEKDVDIPNREPISLIQAHWGENEHSSKRTHHEIRSDVFKSSFLNRGLLWLLHRCYSQGIFISTFLMFSLCQYAGFGDHQMAQSFSEDLGKQGEKVFQNICA